LLIAGARRAGLDRMLITGTGEVSERRAAPGRFTAGPAGVGGGSPFREQAVRRARTAKSKGQGDRTPCHF
jgi:hypothetical protein